MLTHDLPDVRDVEAHPAKGAWLIPSIKLPINIPIWRRSVSLQRYKTQNDIVFIAIVGMQCMKAHTKKNDDVDIQKITMDVIKNNKRVFDRLAEI